MYNNDIQNVEPQIIKVSHTNKNLVTIPCDHWPMVIELLEHMNSGRLVTFYDYMCYSNTAQYKFHRKLYALYPTKYLSIWWMVKQIIKGMWSDLTYHFNSSHGQCHWPPLRQLNPYVRVKSCMSQFTLFSCMLRQSSTHGFERCHRRIPKANLKRGR